MRKTAQIGRLRGFTLIELLLVIAILGVLAAAVIVAVNPAKRLKQARDTQRKNDIGQMATALEAFYTTKQSYPNALADMGPAGSQDLKRIPVPPPPNASYTYAAIPAGCDEINPANLCTESAVYDALEDPAVAGNVWCWRSVTGRAAEAASCTP